jgi:hypothetical protein
MSNMNIQTIARKTTGDKIAVALAPKAASQDRTVEWLNEQIAKGRKDAFCEIVTLTPVLAAALLNRNNDNRPFSKLNFERLCADLEGGRAEFNGESIIVSDDGFLNDGQHRCTAVRDTGRALRTVMVFGVQRHSRFTVDTGNARTVGNFIGMQGMDDSNNLATVSMLVWLFREYNTLRVARRGNRDGGRLRKPTKTEILSVATSFPDVAVNLRLTKPSAPGGRATNAFCRWAIARKCGDAAAAVFFENLGTGASLKPNSPILFVREKLLGDMRGASIQERSELIFKAWNMTRRDEVITHFQRNGKDVVNGIRTGSAVLPAIEV